MSLLENISDESFRIGVLKIMANIDELTVEDYPDWKQPNVGDLVEIISWDTQCNVQECCRLAKLGHLTIKEVIPYVVGCGHGRYCWAYEICVEESQLQFLQWHYKVIG